MPWLNSWCCHWAVRLKIKHPPSAENRNQCPLQLCCYQGLPPSVSFCGICLGWWFVCSVGRFVRCFVLESAKKIPLDNSRPLLHALEQICDFLLSKCLCIFLNYPHPLLIFVFCVFSYWCLTDKLLQWCPFQALHTLDIFHYPAVPFKLCLTVNSCLVMQIK